MVGSDAPVITHNSATLAARCLVRYSTILSNRCCAIIPASRSFSFSCFQLYITFHRTSNTFYHNTIKIKFNQTRSKKECLPRTFTREAQLNLFPRLSKAQRPLQLIAQSSIARYSADLHPKLCIPIDWNIAESSHPFRNAPQLICDKPIQRF